MPAAASALTRVLSAPAVFVAQPFLAVRPQTTIQLSRKLANRDSLRKALPVADFYIRIPA